VNIERKVTALRSCARYRAQRAALDRRELR
jgi:hypothetical protein